MEAKLSHLTTLPSKDQANGYLSLLSDILVQADQSSVASDIRLLVDFATQDHVNIVVGRPVLAELVKALDEKRVKDRETRKAIVEDCLRIIQPRISRFEEQVSNMGSSSSLQRHLTETKATSLRYQLADYLEEEEDFSESARVLMGIQFEAGQRCVSHSYNTSQ